LAWIETISVENAKGALQREYSAAIQRAGRVWNIVKLMSLNPGVLRASMGVYLSAMHGPSPLTRAQREMLAVVVSKANDCHY
jgi:alkylhydroperoxidase family enzyme